MWRLVLLATDAVRTDELCELVRPLVCVGPNECGKACN